MISVATANMSRRIRFNFVSVYSIYLFLVAILIPIDWFGPTGLLLREFGAKPANIILTLGGLYGVIFCRPPRKHAAHVEVWAVLVCFGVLALGVVSFCVNQIAGWTSSGYTRSPFVQFVNQALLLSTAMISIIGNARLAGRYHAVVRLRRIVPWGAALHLVFFLLQALSIIDHYSPFLLLFRNDGGAIERPTGLMSEPSYYGTCAALYGAILLTLPAKGVRYLWHVLLAIALYATAVAINAKTIVMVAGAQIVLAIVFPATGRVSYVKALLLLGIVISVAVFFITQFSALDVTENLSSAMRLGSTLLSLNASLSGYAISGIGIGQFHFFYRDIFAPDFLYLSAEGLEQLSFSAEGRASTFNMFTRFVLEFGVVGFLVFSAVLFWFFRTRLVDENRYIATLLAGSLGFLMTQDTYFYPPLVVSCFLFLAVRYSAAEQKTDEAKF